MHDSSHQHTTPKVVAFRPRKIFFNLKISSTSIMTHKPSSPNKKRIILIDDDQDDHETFRLALNEVEPTIDCVYYHSAKDALGNLTNASSLPDYIFLDLDMPGMNGIQFLEQFKRNEVGQLRIVIFSTRIFPIIQQKIDELGNFYTLVKPNTDAELVSILKSILRPTKIDLLEID
jgi:CheY-like chemotaxis protein